MKNSPATWLCVAVAGVGRRPYTDAMIRALSLHPSHVEAGARLGSRGGAEVVLGFTAATAEYRMLQAAVGVADRSYRAVLWIHGPEAKSYLHGLVTNDVKGVPPGQGNYTSVINARGKMLGDGRLLVLTEDEVLLDLEPEAREQTVAHLQQLLISEDCELDDVTGAWVILGAYGPRAGEAIARLLGAPPPPLALHAHLRVEVDGLGVFLVGASPAGIDGYEIVVAADAAAGIWEQLSAAGVELGGGRVGEEALDAARIHHAIPRYGSEMNDATIPLEANLEKAISYTKGCYVGQEVIAKATYRGQVRRKLARLEVPIGAVAGASLLDGERVVGSLASVLDPDPAGGQPIALAYVRPDRLSLGNRLAIEGGGEAIVTWAPPPKE